MDEHLLRWQARIGSRGVKLIAFLIGFFAAIVAFVTILSLPAALNNTGVPEVVNISQLVKEEIGQDRYITVSGIAVYRIGYSETEKGKAVTDYYFLVDPQSRQMILVQSPKVTPDVHNLKDQAVTISGVTHGAPYKLQDMIESDLPDMHKAGLTTLSTLILHEGQEPVNLFVLILELMLLALVILLCLIPWLFPSIVFAPHALPPQDYATIDEAGVRATGRFLRLKTVQPIQIGKGTRKFEESVANLMLVDGHQLMIYIHYILTYRYSALPVFRQKSDWAVFLDATNLLGIEPGKLYGWHDRWALRFRYKDAKDKIQSLILSFDHANAQVNFVNELRQEGFVIGAVSPVG